MEERILRKLERLKDIPTLPIIFNQVVRLTKDDASSIQELASVIMLDQSLTSKILRVANSSFYGVTKKIANVKHAMIILGYNTIRSLAMGISVINHFSENFQKTRFDLNSFWAHSLRCAILSEMIAKKIKCSKCEDVFTAGLLHDIGKIILFQCFGEDYLKTEDLIKNEQEKCRDKRWYEIEEMVVNTNHLEAGEWFAKKSNLPEPIVQAISSHNKPFDENTGISIGSIVFVGNMLSKITPYEEKLKEENVEKGEENNEENSQSQIIDSEETKDKKDEYYGDYYTSPFIVQLGIKLKDIKDILEHLNEVKNRSMIFVEGSYQ